MKTPIPPRPPRKPRTPAGPPGEVREPVQVYLAGGDRERLLRLTERLGISKSEAIRRGLAALESLEAEVLSCSVPGEVDLPSFGGRGLLPGVDLDDTRALLDRMEGERGERRGGDAGPRRGGTDRG